MLQSSRQTTDSSLIPNLISEIDELKMALAKSNKELSREREICALAQEESSSLLEQLRQLKREAFGKRSERWVPLEQTPLFNEAEVLAALGESDEIDVKAHTKARGKRKPLPENLPREIVIIDIPESEKTDSDGNPLVRLVGKEISEQLEYSPSTLKVIETHRLKYEAINSSGEAVVKTAPHGAQILPKSMGTSSLVAGIAVHKFADGLPFYRLEEIFERAGVTLPRQTMARWIVTCAEKCQPIWNVLEERLMSSPYVSIDETWTQVLKETGKRAESKSWMWVRANPGCDKKIILFDYDPQRTAEVARRLFQDYRGFLQADGYDAYGFTEKTSHIVRIGCNMHGRRYFEQARVSGLEKTRGLSEQGLEYYRRLYAIEEKASLLKLTNQRRFELRLREALPILEAMKLWVEVEIAKVPPKGKIGKAFRYFLNQYDYLCGYLKDGQLEIDNGFVERMIRKFAIGRNNWMFSDTVAGAQASSLFYSFVITAKVNGVDPYSALKRIFDELPLATTIDDFERLANYLLSSTIV
jgi:transposase